MYKATTFRLASVWLGLRDTARTSLSGVSCRHIRS